MSNKEIKIELLKSDSMTIKKLVKLHKQLFDKDHFTATFSEDLLQDYFNLLLASSMFKYAAVVDNEYVGYLIGGAKLDNVLSDFSKKYFFRLIYHLLMNPKFIKEKIQDFSIKVFSYNQKSSAQMRLFLIAAKHSEEIKGVGKKLIQHFEQNLLENNINVYGLSVRKHNAKAIDFYIQHGFIEEFRIPKSIYFIKHLD